MNDLRKTLVNDLNDVETALCALEGVKPGTIRQNGYTGDFKGVMAYPVLLVQKGREKGMSELKPCPFCGAKPTIVKLNGGYDAGRKDNYGNFAITCKRCDIRFQTFVVSSILKDDGELYITDTKSKAIEAWNRRAET